MYSYEGATRAMRMTGKLGDGGNDAQALSVDVLRDLEQVVGVRVAWAALQDRSESCNPFAGPEWTISWLEHLAGDKAVKPYVVTVSRADELVGILPLWERRSALGARTLYPTLRGNHWVGPFEIPGGIAAPGLGRAVTREIVQHVTRNEPKVAWVRIGLGDTAPWFEPDWLPSDGFAILVASVIPRVVVPLVPDQAFRPRRNLRESLRRSRNRLSRDFPDKWVIEHSTNGARFGDALTRLIDLHRERSSLMKGGVHPDILGDAGTRAIVTRAVTDMTERKAASIFELRVQSRVIASQLVLHTKRSSYLSLSGQSAAAWDYSALTLLQHSALCEAEQSGRDTFDLSAGPITAKLRWGERIDTSYEFDVVAPSSRSRGIYYLETSLSRLNALRSAIASDRHHGSATDAHPARG